MLKLRFTVKLQMQCGSQEWYQLPMLDSNPLPGCCDSYS